VKRYFKKKYSIKGSEKIRREEIGENDQCCLEIKQEETCIIRGSEERGNPARLENSRYLFANSLGEIDVQENSQKIVRGTLSNEIDCNLRGNVGREIEKVSGLEK
jgi:hypothetical protein